MAIFIKLTILTDNKEENTLTDIADIHCFRRNSEGKVSVWYKNRDDNNEHFSDDIKDTAGEISKALNESGVKIITL
jgi:ribosome biogenesis protein Nip4